MKYKCVMYGEFFCVRQYIKKRLSHIHWQNAMLNAGIQPFHCVLAHFPPPLPLFSHPQPVLFYFVLLTTQKKWNIKLSAEGNALKISPPFCAPLWVYKIFPGVKVEQGVGRKIMPLLGGLELIQGG